ncbi:MAG: hypothetical protein OM95_04790 [Bdellovibrio sp. ArHS]|uniref:hypothetical protein n=1 Tax=Bdellovibrio sp. ArHS TaxID=1569284 RepID=UPI000582D8FB|nr:hypothetical protein [Bdellovibrio sp. ArHS]KHD89146.1 MAG: hypothetical protein OM95_04790 [Bdellovibrio sp. ArHS]
MRLTNHLGQGVVEAVLSLPLLFLTGSALTALLYRGVVFYYTDYQLHEALLCTQHEPIATCKAELNSRMKTLLITKPSYDISLQKHSRGSEGKVFIALNPELSIQKQLKTSL